MKRAFCAIAVVYAIALPVSVGAQTQSMASEAKRDGIPIEQVIEAVAKKTSKKFVLDPRVRANVNVYGVSTANIGYTELLTILDINNFSAVEMDGFVHVVPMAEARTMPVPTVTGTKQYADSEFVTKVIPLRSVPAATMLMSLRPMIPQYAHMAVIVCTNTLIIVDRYANVKRLAGLIETLDKGEPYKPHECSVDELKK
jgi:general secretion pathway protein D